VIVCMVVIVCIVVMIEYMYTSDEWILDGICLSHEMSHYGDCSYSCDYRYSGGD